jgi:putative tRNA adenosine deaminase-associated protein
VSYATAALARVGSGWTGEELPLEGAEDLDSVVELLQEAVGDEAQTALLFVEEDDEWFAVLRVDAGADDEPRVFISDARVITSSERAALFGEAAVDIDSVMADKQAAEEDDEDNEDDDGTSIDAEPAGDAALLSDLGTPTERLLELCATEGALPSDVISAVCEAAGCLDVLEKIRGE